MGRQGKGRDTNLIIDGEMKAFGTIEDLRVVKAAQEGQVDTVVELQGLGKYSSLARV